MAKRGYKVLVRGVPGAMGAGVSTYQLHYKSASTEDKEVVHVYCERCRYLGSFYVTPAQHLDGVLRRAGELEEGHLCQLSK